MLLGIWQARLSSILYSWLFIFPLLSYLLLGKRWGVGFNTVFIFGGMSLLLLRLVMLESELHFSLFINVGLCLSTLWIMSHVFESKRAEMVERLQLMAALDPLTSVYNRLHLEPVFNLLQQQITGRLALLLVDVDHFKQINDNLGHDAGDRVLQQLARLLQEFVPSLSMFFASAVKSFVSCCRWRTWPRRRGWQSLSERRLSLCPWTWPQHRPKRQYWHSLVTRAELQAKT